MGCALAGALLLPACAGETGGDGVNPCTLVNCNSDTGGSTATGASNGGMPTGSSGSGTTTGTSGSTSTGEVCDVVAEIFRVPPMTGESGRSCALAGACHGDGGEANGALLTGTAEEIAERLLDQPSTTMDCTGMYIDSANPDDSILLIKTSPLHATVCPGGFQMPSLPPLLNAAQTECLTSWVHAVASGAAP